MDKAITFVSSMTAHIILVFFMAVLKLSRVSWRQRQHHSICLSVDIVSDTVQDYVSGTYLMVIV